jgi:hypothetical protein
MKQSRLSSLIESVDKVIMGSIAPIVTQISVFSMARNGAEPERPPDHRIRNCLSGAGTRAAGVGWSTGVRLL